MLDSEEYMCSLRLPLCAIAAFVRLASLAPVECYSLDRWPDCAHA